MIDLCELAPNIGKVFRWLLGQVAAGSGSMRRSAFTSMAPLFPFWSKPMARPTAIFMLAILLDGPAAAQMDFSNNIAGDFAMLNIQHETLNAKLGINGRDRAHSGVPRSPSPRAPLVAGGSYFSASPASAGAAKASFRYRQSPALWQKTAKDFLDRAARRNPAYARSLADEMTRKDFGKIYADFVRPFGIRPDDAADALTAYTILGWMIATGAPDPHPGQIAAVRAQIAQRAAGNPTFIDPRSRAQLGEEMKLSFLILKGGWDSARREGSLRQFSDGVAAQFRRSDVDLRVLQLSNRGFVRR